MPPAFCAFFWPVPRRNRSKATSLPTARRLTAPGWKRPCANSSPLPRKSWPSPRRKSCTDKKNQIETWFESKMVGATRFERATFASRTRRSTKLSHAPQLKYKPCLGILSTPLGPKRTPPQGRCFSAKLNLEAQAPFHDSGDDQRVGGHAVIAVGLAELFDELRIPILPGSRQGIADSRLYPAHGGVVLLRQGWVHLFGEAARVVAFLQVHEDRIPEVGKPLEMGRHAHLVQDLDHLLVQGKGPILGRGLLAHDHLPWSAGKLPQPLQEDLQTEGLHQKVIGAQGEQPAQQVVAAKSRDHKHLWFFPQRHGLQGFQNPNSIQVRHGDVQKNQIRL